MLCCVVLCCVVLLMLCCDTFLSKNCMEECVPCVIHVSLLLTQAWDSVLRGAHRAVLYRPA